MAKRSSEPDYESIREARIAENKALMETLGLRRTVRELNEMATPARRPWTPRQYATGTPRRSLRLKGEKVKHEKLPLKGCLGKVKPVAVDEDEDDEEEEVQREKEEEQQEVAAVDEEVVPAPQDSEDEGMGVVYDDAVPGSPVHPAGGASGAGPRIESAGGMDT